jgi:4-hydroxybenzoate polyprenyltransferase
MDHGVIPLNERGRAVRGDGPAITAEDAGTLLTSAQPRAAGRPADYLKIIRMDHWFKNVLVLPGTAAAAFLSGAAFGDFAPALVIGLASVCLVASANYVLNEWLDKEFDRFHPLKKYRPSAAFELDARIVWGEYAALSLAGLGLAWLVSPFFFAGAAALWVQGLAYNVAPLRTKDRVYLDVLSESVNNPIRLLLGWWIVAGTSFPPSSLVIGYWMLGAFLMGMKRYAEVRFIGSAELAGRYRRSFLFYTEESLLISTMFYAFAASFCFAVFILRHRPELLLTLPFVAAAFAWYVHIGMKPASAAQTPERLHRERGFVAYLGLVAALMVLAFVVDFPWLTDYLDTPFVAIR